MMKTHTQLIKSVYVLTFILVCAFCGCSSVEITESDYNVCAKSVLKWLQKEKPEIEDKDLFVTVEDIDWIRNNFPKTKPDFDKAGGCEQMLAIFKKKRISHHSYCRRGFAKLGIDFKDLSFLSYRVIKKDLEVDISEYNLTVYLKHPDHKGPLAFSFDALPVGGKLKLTDGLVLKVYSGNR